MTSRGCCCRPTIWTTLIIRRRSLCSVYFWLLRLDTSHVSTIRLTTVHHKELSCFEKSSGSQGFETLIVFTLRSTKQVFFKAFPCWHFSVSIFVSLWMSAADGMVCAIKLTSIQVFIMSGKTDIWWEFFFSNHQARHFSSGVSGKPIISRCLTGHRPLSLKIL